MIVVTEELLEQLKTPAGGFNQAAMEIIGNWPLVTGWRERLIGSTIADRKWKAAVKLAKKGPVHRYRGNTRRR